MQFLHAASRPRQLRDIEAEFITDVTNDARIKGITRSSKRQPHLASFSMYSDFAVTFMATRMLTGIDTTPFLDQPISKRPGFHCELPSSV
jgi:hypothetical protein